MLLSKGRNYFYHMDDIRLRIGRARQRVTAVPDIFIDEYMKDANGEYVKIYLYLLRCLSRDDGSFSVSEMADRLDHTERDISRALRYWEKQGLVSLEFDGNGELTGLTLTDLSGSCAAPVVTSSETAFGRAPVPVKAETQEDGLSVFPPDEQSSDYSDGRAAGSCVEEKVHAPEEIEAAAEDDADIQDTLQAAQIYLGRPVTQKETATFFSWYKDLKLPADLISYLIESCIEAKHPDFSYMNAVALKWAEKGYRTREEAEMYDKVYSGTYYAVMKAFGISGRKLSDAETAYVDKWVAEYAFSDGIIAEACRKTILKIGTLSFPYADSILTRWHEAGVTSLSAISALDKKHISSLSEGRDFAVKTGPASTEARNPKIHSFPEHEYDFAAIEKKKRQRKQDG